MDDEAPSLVVPINAQDHIQGKDFLGGAKSGVNGTPSLFINGERFDESLDEETLIEVISEQKIKK